MSKGDNEILTMPHVEADQLETKASDRQVKAMDKLFKDVPQAKDPEPGEQ